MMIKDLGAGVFSVWEGLRPKTKKLLVGALQSNSAASPNSSTKNFSYDAHADWELSRLLTALAEQSRTPASVKDPGHMREISQLAETCVRLLEAQSGSAEA